MPGIRIKELSSYLCNQSLHYEVKQELSYPYYLISVLYSLTPC
jgi:hypothetical protein